MSCRKLTQASSDFSRKSHQSLDKGSQVFPISPDKAQEPPTVPNRPCWDCLSSPSRASNGLYDIMDHEGSSGASGAVFSAPRLLWEGSLGTWTMH